MDPDGRVIVALSFTLARRESTLLGIRVKGDLQVKRSSVRYPYYAPDGYVNISGKNIGEAQKQMGRHDSWIEQDPDRAQIIRCAFELLFEDLLTLEQICEELHARGYRYRSNRPFIEIKKNGKRKANTLSSIFHNWAYIGWLTSKAANILPKTIRGNWEPIVSTEEFEKGLNILNRRNQHRVVRRKHDYPLKGMIYYQHDKSSVLQKLTGSTSNTRQSRRGTAYYCVPRSNVNFRCENIDIQISASLRTIQVDPKYIPKFASITCKMLQKLLDTYVQVREQGSRRY